MTVKCDFCDAPAVYDTQTKMGPWAYVCQKHFDKYSTKIKGLFSELIVEQKKAKICSICGKEKSTTEFYNYIDARGITRARTECKECNLEMRKMNRMRMEMKKDGKC